MFFKKKKDTDVDVIQKIKDRIAEDETKKNTNTKANSDEDFLNDLINDGDEQNNAQNDKTQEGEKVLDDINKVVTDALEKNNNSISSFEDSLDSDFLNDVFENEEKNENNDIQNITQQTQQQDAEESINEDINNKNIDENDEYDNLIEDDNDEIVDDNDNDAVFEDEETQNIKEDNNIDENDIKIAEKITTENELIEGDNEGSDNNDELDIIDDANNDNELINDDDNDDIIDDNDINEEQDEDDTKENLEIKHETLTTKNDNINTNINIQQQEKINFPNVPQKGSVNVNNTQLEQQFDIESNQENNIHISDKTQIGVKNSITELIENVKNQVLNEKQNKKVRYNNGKTLEQFVADLIQPKIIEYLDNNVERIVQDIVKEEIKKIIEDTKE